MFQNEVRNFPNEVRNSLLTLALSRLSAYRGTVDLFVNYTKRQYKIERLSVYLHLEAMHSRNLR